MTTIIDKILNSQPSLFGVDNLTQILVDTLHSDKYVMFHSKLLDMNEVSTLAEYYTLYFSTILIEEIESNSTQPYHVLREIISDNSENFTYTVLLYANGAVMLIQTDDEEYELVVFMTKELCDMLEIEWQTPPRSESNGL